MLTPHPLGLRRPAKRPFGVRGFTLIELMIALVVLGLLAGVALPSFLDAIRKSRRSDAIAALNTIMQAQERFRSNRAEYSNSLTNAANGDPPGLGLSTTSPSGYYTLSLANVSASGYEVIAVPSSGSSQSSDGNCSRLRVRSVGGNLFYGSSSSGVSYDEAPGNRCWSR